MKEKLKETMRYMALVALAFVAMALLCGEVQADEPAGTQLEFAARVAGLVTGYIAVRLMNRWLDAGKLPWLVKLTDYNEEED